MSETEAEIARIATLIQELGYRAQISGETISTAMSGWWKRGRPTAGAT